MTYLLRGPYASRGGKLPRPPTTVLTGQDGHVWMRRGNGHLRHHPGYRRHLPELVSIDGSFRRGVTEKAGSSPRHADGRGDLHRGSVARQCRRLDGGAVGRLRVRQGPVLTVVPRRLAQSLCRTCGSRRNFRFSSRACSTKGTRRHRVSRDRAVSCEVVRPLSGTSIACAALPSLRFEPMRDYGPFCHHQCPVEPRAAPE